MRLVRPVMGTVASIDAPGLTRAEHFETVFGRLGEIEARFSAFLADSELSCVRRGEVGMGEMSREMGDVMKACLEWERATDGWFSAWWRDGLGDAVDGRRDLAGFDPTGYVKGWAVAEAGRMLAGVLAERGSEVGDVDGSFLINIGGDVLAAGPRVWRLGVQDPRLADGVLGVVDLAGGGAMATSGIYERGQHIFDPRTGRPAASDLVSATVAGPDIVVADMLATACAAAGSERAEALVARFEGYRLMSVVI